MESVKYRFPFIYIINIMKILKTIRFKGKVYGKGQESELKEVLDAKQVKDFNDRGLIETGEHKEGTKKKPKEYTKADLEKVNRKADLVVIADKVGAKVVPDDQNMKEMRQVILEAQK